MSIEVANIALSKIHRVVTHEKADFISHRIPGLEGDVVQDMGRYSVRLRIDGIFYGEAAKDDLSALRDVYKERKPVDFLAEIVGQAYFSQVIIEQFDVRQAAEEPDQFTYQMTVAEYVPPPSPAAGLALPDIDAALSLDALDFMDMIQLPDLLSVPDFGDPTTPLKGALEGLKTTLGGATGATDDLTSLFGGAGGSTRIRTRAARSRDLAAANGGIFGALGQLSDGNILTALEAQLTKLVSAGDTATGSQQQSGGIITTLGNAVSRIATPNINKTQGIQRGFDDIKGVLPQNAGEILRGIPEGIDGLFSNLEDTLIKPLDGIFDRFSVLKTIGLGNSPTTAIRTDLLDLSSVNAQIQQLLGTNSPFPNAQNRDLPIVDTTKVLAFLPNPLTAQTLLEALSNELNKLPREQVPLQNIPLYDELNDKLNTALGWLRKDATALGAELADSTTRLTHYIHTDFYDKKLLALKTTTQNAIDATNLTALKNELIAIPTDFDALATLVNGGNLATADEIITRLSERIGAVRAANEVINQSWLGTEGVAKLRFWQRLGESLEDSMGTLLMLASPSNDLKIIGLAIKPLNQLFDDSGVIAFVGGLHKLFVALENLLKELNLETIMATVEGIVTDATDAIKDLQNLLVNATVELSMLFNKVEQFINDLNIAVFIAELKGVLTAFEAATVRGLTDIFSPLRTLLQTAFQTINGVVAAINLEQIIDEVIKLIQELTKILSDPTLLDTIHRVKTVLGDVTNELGSFSIRPVTSTVIDGIGVVKSAFDVIGHLPLPDSIKKEVQDALKLLPPKKKVAEVVTTITDEYDTINKTVKDALEEIKDKPTELVHKVEEFSPDKYTAVTDKLFKPYNEFIDKFTALKPTVLMLPVNKELAKLRVTIEKEVNPVAIFKPLQAPFNSLLKAIDDLNPQALIDPLQKKLTEGIHAITARLPLNETDAIFDTVKNIAAQIQEAINTADSLQKLMNEANERLKGLHDADKQVENMGKDVAAKLDNLTDFTPITTALTALENEIDGLSNTAISAFITPVLEDAIAQIKSLDPQKNLVAIVGAKRTFPRTALNALPDSSQKTALMALLDDFDPMNTAFSAPLGGLQDVQIGLEKANTDFKTFLPIWQQRYHQSGVLNRFRQKNMSLADLKTLLKKTVEEQLAETLKPIFELVKHFQALLSALLTEISNLIIELKKQIAGLLGINAALQKMRDTIHNLVTQLESLDITFIATEIKEVFDAVHTQLAAINPEEIGKALKVTFDGILNAIDPNTLLGLAVLDTQHTELVGLIKAKDPQKLLTNKVQPEYDKVLNFLKEFEIADIITAFIEVLERLRLDLEGELTRTVDAYGDMITAIPSDFSAEKQILLST